MPANHTGPPRPGGGRPSPARRAALCGLLFALAVVLGYAESLLAPLLGLPPGVRLGLANTVVMFALYFLSAWPALLLVLLKAGFGLLTRGATAGLLSLAGGLLSFAVMALLLRLPRQPSVLIVSVAGALAHNAGQLLAVRLLFGPFSLYYAPVLIVAGVVAGCLTALVLKALLPALRKAGLAGPAAPPPGKEDKP